ncbi:UDP-N-acetylglucosamine 2-epimerase (non-hydrolyzing) [Fulvivirgaceae bacterium BMA10]|uniref:UDP-N-acetylglucosamine 2-epimerase (Non-hydrolyzing) n=1 Tax=Splendidivirga corallicola TaxID=3051826 RepID=A0ABT8KLP6_9BACT|nr:UDP-N-acetylglucosamine 2-epimerase (non-hydrolyzing) [Fulvivirgaceae bacterium BMA10]
MKLITIIGARPQFIKAAAVSREISKHEDLTEIIVHTGQHFDENMSEIFFEELQIPRPHYNLDINSVGHGAMTGRMLEGIEEILIKEHPDFVLVYGDTNSTIAGALAAKKLKLKVVHIEAGLRSFNMDMPEEINRILTDRISDILFCPTQVAYQNLVNEGFKNYDCNVVVNGDVMQDAAIFYSKSSEEKSGILKKLDKKDFILCTIHRAENTDNRSKLRNIVETLNKINREISVVLPLHPRTLKILQRNNISAEFDIIDPVGYLDMIQLLKHCSLVMTDSGGLQKEAYFFNKNCITLREETEWVELIEYGYNILVGSDPEKIYHAYSKMIKKEFKKENDLYGGGRASEVIVNNLLKTNLIMTPE